MKIDRTTAVIGILALILSAMAAYALLTKEAAPSVITEPSKSDPVVGIWVATEETADPNLVLEFFSDGVMMLTLSDSGLTSVSATNTTRGEWVRVGTDRIRITSTNALGGDIVVLENILVEGDFLHSSMNGQSGKLRRK